VSAWRVALEARGLGSVSINVRITAMRKLAVEAGPTNGLLAPELAAGITRVEGAKSKGVCVGNWLSVQRQKLLTSPDVSTKKRAARFAQCWRSCLAGGTTPVEGTGAHAEAHPAAGQPLVAPSTSSASTDGCARLLPRFSVLGQYLAAAIGLDDPDGRPDSNTKLVGDFLY